MSRLHPLLYFEGKSQFWGTPNFFGPVLEAHFLRPVLGRPDTLRSRRPSNPSIRHPSDFAPVVCDPVAEAVA